MRTQKIKGVHFYILSINSQGYHIFNKGIPIGIVLEQLDIFLLRSNKDPVD
jgi:hypothetical protein